MNEKKVTRRTLLTRQEPTPLESIIPAMLAGMKISDGLREYLVMKAWDKVTGADAFTLSKYVKDNVLYCTMKSSVVRAQLQFKVGEITKAINDELASDPMLKAFRNVFIKSVVLK